VFTLVLLVAAAAALGLLLLYSRTCLARRIGALTRQLAEVDKERSARSDNIVQLYEASRVTSQEAESGGLVETLADDAKRIVGCESASVAIFIEKDILRSVSKGLTNEFKRNLRWRVRKGGMTEHVLATGAPLVVNDAEHHPLASQSSAVKIGKRRSILAVPLTCENEVLGVLYLGDSCPGAFGDRDLMLATILANHAATAIRQARLHGELKTKLEELECAHKELVGADRLKTDFISTVTSEMRVPLDAIRTYSQTLLERVDDASFKLRKKFLGAVVDESSRLLSTVNGIIDLSRMEFGDGELRREQVAVGDVLKDACGILEPLCMEKGVDISLDVPTGLGVAHLDKNMVFLLFRNLLDAAAGFARKSTSMRLTLGEDEEFVRVEVSLAPSSSAVNMEGALRAISGNDQVAHDAGTLGLTLQVCRTIVLRHGGRIWCETDNGTSWKFIILFGKGDKSVVPSDLTFELITSRPELRRMLGLVADLISQVMAVRRCLIFLEQPAAGRLTLEACVDYDGSTHPGMEIDRGEGATGRVFERGKPILLNSGAMDADSSIGGRLAFERMPCAAVAIKTEGHTAGVITISERTAPDDVLGEADLGLFAALVDRVGVALERTTSYETAKDQFVSVMTAMKSILEARRLPSAMTAVGEGREAGKPIEASERHEAAVEAGRDYAGPVSA
jgi:GAF domain-containing protein